MASRVPSPYSRKETFMICSMTRFGVGIIVALTEAVLPQTASAVTYTAADTFDLSPFLPGTSSSSC
jgi:hypothetical protein